MKDVPRDSTRKPLSKGDTVLVEGTRGSFIVADIYRKPPDYGWRLSLVETGRMFDANPENVDRPEAVKE